MDELCLYIGYTYAYDQFHLFDEQMTTMSESLEDTITYLSGIRHLPIVNSIEDLDDVKPKNGYCAQIVKIRFQSEAAKRDYLFHPDKRDYLLVEFGEIDRRLSGLSKKEARNVKIPVIVATMIDDEASGKRIEMQFTIRGLKEAFYYINGVSNRTPEIEEDSKNLIKAINTMTKLMKSDNYEIEEGIYNRAAILFCGEPEYRSSVKTAIARYRLDHEYSLIVMRDYV